MAKSIAVLCRTFIVLCCLTFVVSYPDKRRNAYDESDVTDDVTIENNVFGDDVKEARSRATASEEDDLSRESDLQLERNPLWLEDFEKLIHNDVDVAHAPDLQADSPAHVPTTNSTIACHLTYKSTGNKNCVKKTDECSTTSHCGSKELWCCYDSCRFVCQQKESPPLVDWRRSPYSLKDGRSWLLQGRSNNYISVVSDQCSTVAIGDEASLLRCRHGYVCHIDDAGDVAKSIPDRGHCVPQQHVKDSFDVQPAVVKVKIDTSKAEGDCAWTGQLLPDKARFYYNGHPCSCESGLIKCYLENKEDVKV